MHSCILAQDGPGFLRPIPALRRSQDVLRHLLAACTILLLSSSCSTIHSTVSVPAGEQFELGDNTHDGFTARLINTGSVPTEVVQRSFGVETPIAELQPGETARVRFPADATVLLRNRSEAISRVRVKLTGDTGLSMGYAPAGQPVLPVQRP